LLSSFTIARDDLGTMNVQPSGTVTLVFTDIEASTRLLSEVGLEQYRGALGEHRRSVREAFAGHGGYEVDYEGDAFFYAFANASDAVSGVTEAMGRLATGVVQVRAGIHTGEPALDPPKYVGIDVHRAARIMACAHGGQAVLSSSTRELLGDDVPLLDLGEHRLRDLPTPVRLYQLGLAVFPPLKTLFQTSLPVPTSPLVGRERELAEVVAFVRNGSRLVTLTGAGGSGKTRLALAVAAEVAGDFRDGVWFVSCAPLTDAALVEPTIAQVVGAPGELSSFLRARNLLLVLDNVEQLLPDAAIVIAELPARALLTSRERLAISGEQEYPLAPLSIEEGVALFVQSARRVEPFFDPDDHVTEIVRRVDGLPLAIELAAARVKLLSAQQIEERLAQSLELLAGGARDMPQRQRTLWAAIDWSYELLAVEERRALRALAIFPGGFTIDAAGEVAETELETLGSLVDKSLIVRTADGRLSLLATIREFLRERLSLEGEVDAAAARHAAFYDAWLPHRHAQPGVENPALGDRAREADNVRALVEWVLAQRQAERAVSVVSRAASLWHHGGQEREARDWVDRALALEPAPSPAVIDALNMAAVLRNDLGDPDAAIPFLDRALALMPTVGDDPVRMNETLILRAVAHHLRGEVTEARACFERALALQSDDARRASTLHNLGTTEMLGGNYDRGAELLGESLALEVARGGSGRRLCNIYHSLGDLALRLDDTPRAIAAYRDAYRLATEFNLRQIVAPCAGGLAAAAAMTGASDDAAQLWRIVERLEDEYGRIPKLERAYYVDAVGEAAQQCIEETGRVSADEALRLLNTYVELL
jgi:predicted ATPase/class 3 adenylate cyclase